MARPRTLVPRLCTDKTGRCFCKVRGKFVSLGRADDPQVHQRYAALLTSLNSSPVSTPTAASTAPTGITVSELMLKFALEVMPKYRRSDGQPSAEQDCFRSVIKIVRRLFGETPAVDFGPLRLRLCRSEMVKAGWSRKFVNKQTGRLRLMFRWAVSWELIPQVVADALKSVAPLDPGETEARETKPRRSIPAADLKAVRDVLLERHRDALDLLLLCGARPGELLSLTTAMIDRSGEVWRVDLEKHKTAHHEKSRTLYFNRTAQAILQKYLKADPDERLFPFTRGTFSQVISYACERAEVTPFVPHQLRHTVATQVVDQLGLEFAQQLLGHSNAAMTQHYSKSAEQAAMTAVQKLG